MSNDNARDQDRVWQLMKKIGFAMLVTHDGGKLRARPMSAYLEQDNNAIFFLTDARRHKDEEIAGNPAINLSFADASSQKYVSIAGTATVSNDRAKIEDQRAVFDPGESLVGQRRGSEHSRVEDHPRRCGILGFARHRHQLCENGRGRRDRHTAGHRREPQGLDVMPIEPPEIPPTTPGKPTEPPPEAPPGSPRPEVPPPVREPGQPPQPQELPRKTPDELPVRGPNGPRTPNPATDRGTGEGRR
jgi:uncharacterized pyridoxamine 5'-phosphate oxidase family protein